MSDSALDFILLDPPADALSLSNEAAADHVANVQRWLEDAVIGLNLCPFAKAVHVKRQVRYVVSRATMDGDVLDHLENQGVGGAVMTGYRAAIADGDCPHCWTPCEAYPTIIDSVF